MDPFKSQEIVGITHFTDHCPRNFFFAGESLFPLHRLTLIV